MDALYVRGWLNSTYSKVKQKVKDITKTNSSAWLILVSSEQYKFPVFEFPVVNIFNSAVSLYREVPTHPEVSFKANQGKFSAGDYQEKLDANQLP